MAFELCIPWTSDQKHHSITAVDIENSHNLVYSRDSQYLLIH